MYSKLADSDYCSISKNCRSANIVVLGSSKRPGKDGFFSREVDRGSLLFITKNMGGAAFVYNCFLLLRQRCSRDIVLVELSREQGVVIVC